MSTENTHNIPEKFLSPYSWGEIESALYTKWEESGYFNPDSISEDAWNGKYWSTIMPPPNANGRLHAGHGLDMTLKDILTRFKRMQGYRALFLPGADHAGFETQIVYEKKLTKEGRSRFQMTPQELYKEILDFTLENKGVMESDIRRLGTSCDWTRNTFTLDDSVVDRVHQSFVDMYNDGLVYRGERIVNWCPKHQTSLSEVETESVEQPDKFYYFQYGPFEIGTARPETKFGDKYIVVHPDDDRYKQYEHGQKFTVEWINDAPIEATLIKDEVIDMELGTGAMTITPWHSQVDFELALKHGLDKEQIIDERGKLLPIAEGFEGMKIEEAREKIVKKLDAKGLVTRVDEDYTHAVKKCYKCARTIEPQVRDQWFVKMEPLAKLALDAVKENKVNFISSQFEKIYTHWMENTIDWNISRQIVWGISIPAWFKNKGTDAEEISVGIEQPDGDGWERDTDTFDTWFSSGQWPLLTTGFPDSDDFKTYYPSDLMETGRDLIFKWIPRMVMFGMYRSGQQPFNDVYLHGMINDEKNKKMSKSKGNVLSPIDLADEFGTDALRMALVVGNTPGNDMALSKDKIRGYKKFANKIWNATRFVLESTEGLDYENKPELSEQDAKYIADLEALTAEITKEMEEYKLYIVAEKLYHQFWDTFASVIIEDVKNRMDESGKWTLYHLLVTQLRLLHPFMPYITEEIWQSLPHKKEREFLMVEEWPSK